ncbi:MAG: cation:proton antiporter [Dysgonomonas sp.]
MAHLPDFITDLAIILITAGVVTIIFKWLKQPIVLGYIVAGFIASPNFGLAPTVTDMVNVSTWAEIGVVFLLFALGLEFSFKKLVSVGGTASIATVINMGSMIAIGYLVGQLMGWSQMDSIFLGGMLSMSSTTIIIKAFTDMGLQRQKFANIVFGMLIVEDLAAILMMVLLSTIAVSQHFEGHDLIYSMLKLVFFMVIWFVVGIYLIPTLLKKFKKYLNDETLLIVAAGLCLGMVLFANAVGFSAALGAFIMGSILAETVEAKHIEHLIEPIKNLFGAVFFVSVGMMIAPDILVEYAVPILILTGVVLVGRIIFATLGVLASGEGLKVSLQAGLSLAQIGEFSFIIATLGMQLGVIDKFLYPVIVAVSVITTFTTPYCIKSSDKIYNFIEKRIPSKWEKLINGYASSGYKSINAQSDWHKLLKTIAGSVAIYLTISIAILFICSQFITPFILGKIEGIWGRLLSAAIILTLMAPFLRAILRRKNNSALFKKLWNDSNFNKGALISLTAIRAIIVVALIIVALYPLFPKATAVLVIIAFIIVALFIFTTAFKAPSVNMEKRFMSNLNEREKAQKNASSINEQFASELQNKQLHIEEFEIPQESKTVGKTLAEMNFKQLTGVYIVTVIRGANKINIPNGSVRLFPFDKIVVVGTDGQIREFGEMIAKAHAASIHEAGDHHVELSQFIVEEGSSFIGKTIRELNIPDKTGCMVIGIDRDGASLKNMTPDTFFNKDDVIWIAGEKENLNSFEEHMK